MNKLLLFVIAALINIPLFAQTPIFNKKPWENEIYPIIIDPYQANEIDFDKLIADKRVVGIIHKASQGFKSDNKYLTRSQIANSKHLLYASYHLGTNSDPVKQADFYLDIIKNNLDEPMALDIEDIGGNNISLIDAEKFINRIYEKTKTYPFVYINNKVFIEINNKYDKQSVFAKCPLWYARFTPTLPALSKNVWDSVTLWQFSCEINCKITGKCLYNVPGTKYDMDINIYNGTQNQLKIFWTTFSNLSKNFPIDNYIHDNFTNSDSTKKQIIGKHLKCGYDEAYFIKGYNSKQEVIERAIVFKKNGNYYKSFDFFRWCASNSEVKYLYKDSNTETLEDIKALRIDYHPNGKFYVINTQLFSKSDLKEQPNGFWETTFDKYLEQISNCD